MTTRRPTEAPISSLHMLASSALVFFYTILLFFHLSGGARKMKKKQNGIKELFQAAKRRDASNAKSVEASPF